MSTELLTQRSIPDVIAEYQTKSDAIDGSAKAFEDAVRATEMASVVSGQYAGTIWYRGAPTVYASSMQKNLLESAWKHLYAGFHMDKLATAKDKSKFDTFFANPLPFTLPNIRDTFGDYIRDPRYQILRGLAECFSDLDPAYKSHSKVKIGVKGLPKRVIITSVTTTCGYGEKQFMNTINALAVYKGEPLIEWPAFRELLNAIEYGDRQTTYKGMRLKGFANGNLHIFFDDITLVDINKALAEFYGDILPDAEPEGEVKKKTGTEVSKDLQYYPTPKSVVKTILNDIYLVEGTKVLEPSCGCGRFMDAIRETGADVLGVEVDFGRVEECKAKGHNVVHGNFLDLEPTQFDVVIMNPPFSGKHYLKHIEHALKFIGKGGTLVCILPAAAYYDHGEIKGFWRDLPLASFRECGTNVSTGYLTIKKRNW